MMSLRSFHDTKASELRIKWMMQVCTVVSGNTTPIASGNPLSPSTTAISTSLTPRVLTRGSSPRAELGALGLLDPQPQHLFLAVAVEGEGNVDRLVAHQPLVADLDPQRIEENHRIDRIERPALPFPNFLENRIGDPADQIGGNLDPVELLQVRLDLANRQTPGIEADDPIVETVEPGLPLGDNLRLEAAVAVARYRELDRAVVAEHRFARMAVAAVSAASAGRVALLVPQMLAQLGTQCALQQFLLELFEEPLFTEQILRGAISLQKLLDHLVSDRLCHVRDPLYHIERLTARTYTRYRTPSRLVVIEVATDSPTFSYRLDRKKLRQARRREGRYLLRTNLVEEDPAKLWSHYLLLVTVEEAFKNLKGDLAIRPIFHQLEARIEAHVFIAFLAYCLHVTLARRLRALAPGLTPRSVLEKFAAMQMIDVHLPTTDGRELLLTRYTQPEPELNLLLKKLKLDLPLQPPPKITA